MDSNFGKCSENAFFSTVDPEDCQLCCWDFIHFAVKKLAMCLFLRWIDKMNPKSIGRFRKHSVQRDQVRRDTVRPGTTHCFRTILSKLPFKNSSLLLLAFTPVVNNHWSLWLDPLTRRPFEKRHPVVLGSRLHRSWSVTTGQEMQQTWPQSAGSEHLPQVHTFESLEKAQFIFSYLSHCCNKYCTRGFSWRTKNLGICK